MVEWGQIALQAGEGQSLGDKGISESETTAVRDGERHRDRWKGGMDPTPRRPVTPTCPCPPHPPSLHLLNPNSKTKTKPTLSHILEKQLSVKETNPSEKEQAADLCLQGRACVITGR